MMDMDTLEATQRAAFGVPEPAPRWVRWAALPAMGLLLVSADLALSRLPPLPLLAVLGVGTALLTPRFLRTRRLARWDWFVPAKTVSLIVGVALLLLVRQGVFAPSRTVSVVMWVVMAVNILEAVVAELLRRRTLGMGTWWNPVVGLVLAALFPLSEIELGVAGFRYALPLAWAVVYTVWNLTFVTVTTLGRFTLHQAVVLGVPLVMALIDPDLWVQSRVNTLMLYMLLLGAFFPTIRLRLCPPGGWRS